MFSPLLIFLNGSLFKQEKESLLFLLQLLEYVPSILYFLCVITLIHRDFFLTGGIGA